MNKEDLKTGIIVVLVFISLSAVMTLIGFDKRYQRTKEMLDGERKSLVATGIQKNECSRLLEEAEKKLQYCSGVASAMKCDCSCEHYIDIIMDTIHYLEEKPDDVGWWETNHRGYRFYRDNGYIGY